VGVGVGLKRGVEGVPGKGPWVPPASPYELILEKLYSDPWKLLLACMLLDKTADKQVRAPVGAASLCAKPPSAKWG